MGIELMQGINTWPGTAEDMIDRLIAGYSTGLGVLIDTITYSRFHSGAVNRQAAGMTYTWHGDHRHINTEELGERFEHNHFFRCGLSCNVSNFGGMFAIQ